MRFAIAYYICGISVREIKDICAEIFSEFDIEYCYLFGSYAKSKATENSDIDLLLSTSVSGMRFYDLVEAIREGLQKKVDVLNCEQLKDKGFFDDRLPHKLIVCGDLYDRGKEALQLQNFILNLIFKE